MANAGPAIDMAEYSLHHSDVTKYRTNPLSRDSKLSSDFVSVDTLPRLGLHSNNFKRAS